VAAPFLISEPPVAGIKMRILALRKQVKNFIYDMGLFGVLGRMYAGMGTIFAMHRVVSSKADSLHQELTIADEYLDCVIRYFRCADVDFVSMDEVYARLNGERPGRRFIALTFDDGYRDNLTHALPVLKRHRVPAIVYVASCAPDRVIDPWWLRLERAIRRHDQLVLDWPNFKKRLATDTLARKIEAYSELSKYIHRDLARNLPLVERLLPKGDVDDGSLIVEHFMNWDELRELASDPLITIGAHTVSHPLLSALDESAAFAEMTRGRSRLEEELNVPIKHFAYPFGAKLDCGPREFALAARAGFMTAVTTRKGNIFQEHRNHCLALPRYFLGGSDETISDAVLKFSGIPVGLGSNWKNPIIFD
jgi:peptidoglycan/xylan/chitin deacetylase (PgdA/CDA1 family)